MDNNWTVVSNYISTIRISSKVRDLFVFRYFTSMSTAVHLRQRSAKYCVFAGMFDSNDSTVLCVFPDGTYQDFPTHRLRENIVFVTTVSFDNHSYTPLDYMEVTRIADPRWLDAVSTWSDDFERMNVGTWVRVKDVNPSDLITSRFVFQIKFKESRGWYAFCRWTPRGFQQQAGVHYDPDEIFAGTPQLSTLRFLLAKALFTKRPTYVSF